MLLNATAQSSFVDGYGNFKKVYLSTAENYNRNKVHSQKKVINFEETVCEAV